MYLIFACEIFHAIKYSIHILTNKKEILSLKQKFIIVHCNKYSNKLMHVVKIKINLITNRHWVYRIFTQLHDTYDVMIDMDTINTQLVFNIYINTNKYVTGNDT